jgi:hypothetical protein
MNPPGSAPGLVIRVEPDAAAVFGRAHLEREGKSSFRLPSPIGQQTVSHRSAFMAPCTSQDGGGRPDSSSLRALPKLRKALFRQVPRFAAASSRNWRAASRPCSIQQTQLGTREHTCVPFVPEFEACVMSGPACGTRSPLRIRSQSGIPRPGASLPPRASLWRTSTSPVAS